MCQENAIVCEPYLACDVMEKPNQKEPVRDHVWQEQHMTDLANQVIKVLDNAGSNVRDYIKLNLSEKFKPI